VNRKGTILLILLVLMLVAGGFVLIKNWPHELKEERSESQMEEFARFKLGRYLRSSKRNLEDYRWNADAQASSSYSFRNFEFRRLDNSRSCVVVSIDTRQHTALFSEECL
jgi:hypothetical protein